MYFNFWLPNRPIASLFTRTVLSGVFAFILVAPWQTVDAQSSRRSNSASGAAYQQPQGATAAETSVRAAYLRAVAGESVNFDDYRTVFDWLTEFSGKEKWRKIDWRHDLWDARIESAKTGKPIFIWAMNGDPLGCV